jgi:hypothetical protein
MGTDGVWFVDGCLFYGKKKRQAYQPAAFFDRGRIQAACFSPSALLFNKTAATPFYWMLMRFV